MGQVNCIAPNSKTDQQGMTNADTEKIFDTDGNIIDAVMPGFKGILENINPLQFEQIFNQWNIQQIIVQEPSHGMNAMVDLLDESQAQVQLVLRSQSGERLITLTHIDDCSVEAYTALSNEIELRQSKRSKSQSSAFVKSIVSRNRLRYKDCEFNLDLSYITRRVIAMGYPGSGLNGLVRNHVGDVILYFKKYHSLKIKIYNMCNDKFVDPQVLRLETPAQDRDVRLAYFPMMDHNPGPIPTIFKFVIDAVLYLASDPENTVAVHCKAGKGRTGLAICAYFLFIEAVENAELAVTLFNSRRTTNGKGLGIASQVRYLDYFHQFIKQFKRPYVQLIAPYLRNPTAFDRLLLAKNRLKLMSVCLGPFKANPQSLQITMAVRDFVSENLFKKQQNSNFEKIVVQDKSSGVYYLILLLQNELVIQDDICIFVKSPAANKIPVIDFRFWLNVNYLEQTRRLTSEKDLSINDFVQLTPQQQSVDAMMRLNDGYLTKIQDGKPVGGLQELCSLLRRSVQKFAKNMEKIHNARWRASENQQCLESRQFTNITSGMSLLQPTPTNSSSLPIFGEPPKEDSTQGQQAVQQQTQEESKNREAMPVIVEHRREESKDNRFLIEDSQVYGSKPVESDEIDEYMPVVSRRSSRAIKKEIKFKTKTIQKESSLQESIESKQDVKLLMTKLEKVKPDVYSESEDDFCTVKDDTEEWSQCRQSTIFYLSPKQHQSSFSTMFQTKLSCVLWESIKNTNFSEVLKVSSKSNRQNVPRFGTDSQRRQSKQRMQLGEIDETIIPEDLSDCKLPMQSMLHKGVTSKLQKNFLAITTDRRDTNRSSVAKKNFTTPSNDLIPNEYAFFGSNTLIRASMVSSQGQSPKVAFFGGNSIKLANVNETEEDQFERDSSESSQKLISDSPQALKPAAPEPADAHKYRDSMSYVQSSLPANIFTQQQDVIRPQKIVIERPEVESDALSVVNFMTDRAKAQKPEPIQGERFLHQVVLEATELDKIKNKKEFVKMGFKVQAVFCSDPYYDKFYFNV